jgi:hypothetical protein
VYICTHRNAIARANCDSDAFTDCHNDEYTNGNIHKHADANHRANKHGYSKTKSNRT